MKNVEGYVFVAEGEFLSVAFGIPQKGNKNKYEMFEANGLIPYKSLKQMKKALTSFDLKEFNTTYLARIYMQIAEDETEFNSFADPSNLIVISDETGELSNRYRFYGPIDHSKPESGNTSIPGSELSRNGYVPWNNGEMEEFSFDSIMDQLSEIKRQAQCSGTIAKFKLERLNQEW